MFARLPNDCFVRHDVDVSLDAALAMGRWETERELHATYYLMITSPFYSPLAAAMAGSQLRRLGHTVGVHIDHRLTPLLSPPVLPVSYHCPSADLLWQDVADWDNAYAARWKGAYYADSRGRFAHGDPEDHDGPWPIQLNLHCEYWFEPDWIDRRQVTPELYEQFFYEPMEALA